MSGLLRTVMEWTPTQRGVALFVTGILFLPADVLVLDLGIAERLVMAVVALVLFARPTPADTAGAAS